MSQFLMTRDASGLNSFALAPSAIAAKFVLTSGGSDITVTVPSFPFYNTSNIICIFAFQPGSMVWINYNNTVQLPSGSVTFGTTEANPTGRLLKTGDVIHFNTNDASDEISVIFYPNY